MPILSIIDEQRCALEQIEELARIASESPEDALVALWAIRSVATQAKRTVQAILAINTEEGEK